MDEENDTMNVFDSSRLKTLNNVDYTNPKSRVNR